MRNFEHWRTITAKYPGPCRNCGREVKRGESCGWNRKDGLMCGECFSTWSGEVAAERMMEESYNG